MPHVKHTPVVYRHGHSQYGCAHARGFTLIEVLVALALIALSALAMMRITQEGVVATGAVRERVLAEIVAENKLIETAVAPLMPDIGVTTGRSDVAGQTWVWTQTVSATGDDDILRIDIAVKATDAGSDVAFLSAFRGVR